MNLRGLVWFLLMWLDPNGMKCNCKYDNHKYKKFGV